MRCNFVHRCGVAWGAGAGPGRAVGAGVGEHLKGQQDADYLAEAPLIALMFLVMVWHGRRRLAACRTGWRRWKKLHRISGENLRLLEQQRQFPQDASHDRGTPITVALGHTELIQQAVTDQVVARDTRVVAGELARLGRLVQRLLLLAAAQPGFPAAGAGRGRHGGP